MEQITEQRMCERKEKYYEIGLAKISLAIACPFKYTAHIVTNSLILVNIGIFFQTKDGYICPP